MALVEAALATASSSTAALLWVAHFHKFKVKVPRSKSAQVEAFFSKAPSFKARLSKVTQLKALPLEIKEYQLQSKDDPQVEVLCNKARRPTALPSLDKRPHDEVSSLTPTPTTPAER